MSYSERLTAKRTTAYKHLLAVGLGVSPAMTELFYQTFKDADTPDVPKPDTTPAVAVPAILALLSPSKLIH